ncbi:MAG: hypothetical protein DRP89_04060, partial [Candidatus Neomarinimicrobiota bacterium]
PKAEGVSLRVYNLLGKEVRVLINKQLTAGKYNLLWDGKDQSGNPVSSGIYFYILDTQNFQQVKKMISIR